MTILTTLSLLLLYAHRLCNASVVQTTPSQGLWIPAAAWKRSNSKSSRVVPEGGFYSPLDKVTTPMLTIVPVTYPMGQGEPLNAIILGTSDERVLNDNENAGGLQNYFLSLGFSNTCLGQHAGSHQAADLGDGHGPKNETGVIRWNYGDPVLGACKETIQGGNHFRYWIQDGPEGNSGAVFLAVSYELPLSLGHDIVPNGYNLGRDYIMGNISQTKIPATLVDGLTYSGTTSWRNWTYVTNIVYRAGLAPNTNDGINHNYTVGTVAGVNASDGFVALMNVMITSAPESAAWTPVLPPWQLGAALLTNFLLPFLLYY